MAMVNATEKRSYCRSTRVELANAISEYVEVFYNRRRRQSGFAYATPHDYDLE